MSVISKENYQKKVYINNAQSKALRCNPKNLITNYQRGVGKSHIIQAGRSYMNAHSMPGGTSTFYGATYMGLMLRTLPGTISGWKNSFGWIEDVHFVQNKRPPKKWKQPLLPPLSYKYSISTITGHIFLLGSNDRPGLVNSWSVQHINADEVRFINYDRMIQDLGPAKRGNPQFANVPQYMGWTLTSDMPFLTDEAQWFLDWKNEMDINQIKLIFHFERKVTKVQEKILKHKKLLAQCKTKQQLIYQQGKIKTLQKTLSFWQSKLNYVRMNSTFYDVASSFANINVLTKNYLIENSNPNITPILTFNTSYLGIEPKSVEQMYYTNLRNKHFYQGDFNYDHYDNFLEDMENLEQTSYGDNDCNPNEPLDLSFDFGNMCSCSVSQALGRLERYLKDFYVLDPDDEEDLCVNISNYYRHQIRREINLYYDPAGNYAENKKGNVYGPSVKAKLESLGWRVNLKTPRGSINPLHDAKYKLINKILKEDDPRYPYVRINKENNPNLSSSMNLAPMAIKLNRNGQKIITKVKTSEKLTLKRLPKESTNLSDTFDIKIWHKYHHLLPGESTMHAYTPSTNK